MRLIENFTAGITKRFHVPGNYFFLASVPGGTVTAVLYRDGRAISEDLRDVSARWSATPEGGFDAVDITSSLTQDVAFYISKGRVSSEADVVLAETSAINPQGRDLVVSSGSAFAHSGNPGPVAGQFGYSQLWNPAGSGKVVYCDGFAVSADTAVMMSLRRSDAQLTTLEGAGGNMNLNGAAGSAQVRFQTSAGILGVGEIFGIWTHILHATHFFPLPIPFRIPAGQGLLLRGLVANVELRVMWLWREY